MLLKSCCEFSMRRSGKLVSCHVSLGSDCRTLGFSLSLYIRICTLGKLGKGRASLGACCRQPLPLPSSLDKSINWKSYVPTGEYGFLSPERFATYFGSFLPFPLLHRKGRKNNRSLSLNVDLGRSVRFSLRHARARGSRKHLEQSSTT